MEDVDIKHAKKHLEELIERARRGEVVRISDPGRGAVRLTVEAAEPKGRQSRELGFLEGIIPPPPADFFDPMSEDELKLWYGENT